MNGRTPQVGDVVQCTCHERIHVVEDACPTMQDWWLCKAVDCDAQSIDPSVLQVIARPSEDWVWFSTLTGPFGAVSYGERWLAQWVKTIDLRPGKIIEGTPEHRAAVEACKATKPSSMECPPSATYAIAAAIRSNRQTPLNWRRESVSMLSMLAAVYRHLDAVRDGRDLDPDSGLPHIDHALAGLAIVVDARECGVLRDDRLPGVGK